MKRVYLVLVCIVLILSLFGCGKAETEQPNKELPTEYEYPTTGSDSYTDKSSAAPTSLSDIEKPSTESKEIEDTAVLQTENIPSMDELLSTSYELDFDEENNNSYGYLPNYDDPENSKQITSISVVNKHTLKDGEIVFDEANILTHGYRRIGDVLYVATADAIWRVSPDEKTIIYDAVGNISAMEASKHIILFIDNGVLKAMRLDGSEQRDILYVGDVTYFRVANTTQLIITKRYYNGQIISSPEFEEIFFEQHLSLDLHGNEALEHKNYFQSEVVPSEFYILDIGEDNPQLEQVTEHQQTQWLGKALALMEN